MSEYTGFFVRDNLGQTPGETGVNWSASPDVILAGAAPAAQASQYATASGYNTDYDRKVYAGSPPTSNFVYLRALNTNPAASPSSPVTGRAWFYWLENDLSLWPQTWRSDGVTVAGSPVNYQDIVATAPNQVCQPDLPFVWSPLPPASGQSYSCVMWIENTPSNPPVSPVAGLPPFTSLDDLVNFVLSHPDMGWRSTVNVGGLYTWSQTTAITGPQEPGTFYIGVQCHDMPTDGQLGWSVPGPTPNIPSILVPVSPITNPDLQTLVPVSDWPGGAASSITINYWQGATTPPVGAYITVVLLVQSGDGTLVTLGTNTYGF